MWLIGEAPVIITKLIYILNNLNYSLKFTIHLIFVLFKCFCKHIVFVLYKAQFYNTKTNIFRVILVQS